jgi:para-aminobenzoate synthetase/4-amino-4-deoxychorismate lyase
MSFAAPRDTLVAWRESEVAAALDAAFEAARAGRWAVGFVAYEAAPAFDRAYCVRPSEGALPLAAFAVFDAPAAQPLAGANDAFQCGLWRIATSEAEACAAIERLRRQIADGAFYQVNLTTRLRAAFAGSGAAFFAALHAAQPHGYGLYLDGGDWEILSVSPELFFDWRPDGALVTRPMKGTAPRHADAQRDAAAAAALRASAKERAENLMIVDLLRNDLARIARLGSVRAHRLFELDRLPTVWQMSSTVACVTRPGLRLSDVFAALFPCGSVTGAPKIAALHAIAALEPSPRGVYCGALGLIRPGGHATFSVGIRTVVIDRRQGLAECGVGSGIVFDSAPAAEYAEWLAKRRFLLRATAGFELLETLLLEQGRYFLRERHLARLIAAAEHFGFPCDPASVAAVLDALAAAHPHGAWRVRLLLDRCGQARCEIFPLEPLPGNPVVMLATQPIAASEFLHFKTTERSAYAPFAPPPGVFDTLLWNAEGELTEFTRGNLVVELDGRRITPPLEAGLLPGVMRAELLARGEIVEDTVRVADLARASALWFINSVRGWVRVGLRDPST